MVSILETSLNNPHKPLKMNKSFISLFTLLIASLLMQVSAYDFMVDSLAYNINSDGTSVTLTYTEYYYNYSSNYSGLSEANIPETVTFNGQTYSVISIDRYAFSGCGMLTSVTIPNSVTSIGNYAFFECKSLTSVTIPNSVNSIGNGAFRDCKCLTSVTIPNSVTSIGSAAFRSCTNLTTITVDTNNTKYDSRNNCNAIIETETNTLIAGCMNTIIPNSVTSIGEYAFYYCSGLTNVCIPKSVSTIGNNAFSGCSGLTTITIDADNIKYDSRDNCNAIIETETNTLIDGCMNTAIPNSVTAIGYCAFSGCTGLTSVTIPNSVITIGDYAFLFCKGLTSVTIPNSVITIGDYAFGGCYGLTSITIPNSVTSIGNSSFIDCGVLTSVTLTGSGSWNEWKLNRISAAQIKTLNVGSKVTELGDFGFNPDVVKSYAETPPTCAENTFATYNAPLHIPSASTVAYFTTPYWQNFSNLVNDINEKVSLDKTSVDLKVFSEVQLNSTVSPASMADDVLWCSTNPAVAKVDENGKVTLVGTGECDIFAYLSSIPAVYASCLICSHSGITLDKTEAVVAPNKIITLTPRYDLAVTDIVATSSDTHVAIARVVTIDDVKKVQVVGVNLGTATITVASADGNAEPATCEVTVRNIGDGDLDGNSIVDVEDVNAAINVILKLKTVSDYPGNGDMDGNGIIDVEDVNSIINIILKL